MRFDEEQFIDAGRNILDFIVNYQKNVRDWPVLPRVSPGFLSPQMRKMAPNDGEHWTTIMKDIEDIILPGMTHWQSPYMHAYFPAQTSAPSVLADMIIAALNPLGFTWAACPVATELEMAVTDWLAKAIGLPDIFHHSGKETTGGGMILTTASEGNLNSMLAARQRIIKYHQNMGIEFASEKLFRMNSPPDKCHEEILFKWELCSKLVAYTSEQAHSSLEKAGLITMTRVKLVKTNQQNQMDVSMLEYMIQQDKANELIPFYVSATCGTTGACAFDDISAIGDICKKYGLWLHVDAAYAGSAFICPELRGPMQGIEKADSFVFNPSKWLMTGFDLTAMWYVESESLVTAFNKVNPLYLQHGNMKIAIDYMHWQVPLSRKFRSLKLWMVLRTFGITGIQKEIRKHCILAEKFEELMKQENSKFNIAAERHLGVVVFQLHNDNVMSEQLLLLLNYSGLLHVVPCKLRQQYVIRYVVTSPQTTEQDIKRDMKVISEMADIVTIYNSTKKHKHSKKKPMVEEQISLALSNVPRSPTLDSSYVVSEISNDEAVKEMYNLWLKRQRMKRNRSYQFIDIKLNPN